MYKRQAKYWQWTLGQSTNDYETLGNPGICSGPASRVRFPGPSLIGGDAIHIATNHITIPDGTPLFFPVFCLWQDNGNCPLSAFTTFTAVQLAGIDETNWSATTETSGTIDGVAVDGMENPTNSVYNVISPPFSYTTAEKDNAVSYTHLDVYKRQLQTWIPLHTNLLGSGPLHFSDPQSATNVQRFYRAQLSP